MGAVVSLVGRLVDLAANANHLTLKISQDDKERIRSLAQNVAAIRTAFLSGRIPQLGILRADIRQHCPCCAKWPRLSR